MKKYLLLTFILTSYVTISFAQTDTTKKEPSPWKLTGVSSLNFVQSSFTNWSAGGNNSVAGTVAGKLNILYKKDKITWETNLELAYGLTFLEGEKRKNNDKIDFSSKFGYQAFKYWNYTGLLSFKSQFDKGYASYPVTDKNAYNSKFFAPAYLILSLGMDYQPIPDFSLLISPITAKFTFVYDDYLSGLKAFGVDENENLYAAWGAYVKSAYTKKLHENIVLGTVVELFSNLLDSPENVAINWELKFDFNITKFIKSNLYTQLMYDDRTKIYEGGKTFGAKVQFKQVLGVGFAYIF
ncbi:MAG: DUF3078 domain-containing protein [Prevotellaceae bacterium]|jgi:hypothetical protein|nr:DUF3078 domain-containing protein [Prevotellaceae bacterium]